MKNDKQNTDKANPIFYHVNMLNEKNHMIISVEVERASDKI